MFHLKEEYNVDLNLLHVFLYKFFILCEKKNCTFFTRTVAVRYGNFVVSSHKSARKIVVLFRDNLYDIKRFFKTPKYLEAYLNNSYR